MVALKSYSVKEIADMLKTNPETVRRWIRNKKLSAVFSGSKKSGSIVYESELMRFLESAPKYANIFRSTSAFAPAFNISVALIGLVAGGALASYADSKRINDARVLPSEAIRYIENEIKIHETNISRMNKEIEALQEDIASEEQQIEQLQVIIKHTGEDNI